MVSTSRFVTWLVLLSPLAPLSYAAQPTPG